MPAGGHRPAAPLNEQAEADLAFCEHVLAAQVIDRAAPFCPILYAKFKDLKVAWGSIKISWLKPTGHSTLVESD